MTEKIKLLVLGIIAALGFTACGQVDNGERGLYVVWGEAQDEVLEEGVYIYNPISTTLKTINVKERLWELQTSAFSSDVQEVKFFYNLSWYPVKDQIVSLYKEFGSEYAKVIILPILEGTIKEVAGKYNAVEMVTHREKLTSEIKDKIKDRLFERNIMMGNFNIVNLDFKDEFEASIEAKVIAVQLAEKAKNDTIRIEEEARQKLIQAEAEAKAMQIKSDALARNKNLIEYEAVQKWNGELPQYMMGNSVPFLNLQGK